jgi:hypothetical protein
MTSVVKFMDQTVSRFVRGAMGTGTHGSSLDRCRIVRKATLDLIAPLSQPQLDFSPGTAQWSIGQIADHLLLTDGLYQPTFLQMIDRARSGDESTLHISIREMNPTVGPIPRAIMPYLAPAFSLFSNMIPHAVRETMLRVPFLPSGHPTLSTPRPGRTSEQLCHDLADSLETTETILLGDLPPNFSRMRAEHPVLGTNSAAQVLDLMSAHEQRHQQQIRGVMAAARFPK